MCIPNYYSLIYEIILRSHDDKRYYNSVNHSTLRNDNMLFHLIFCSIVSNKGMCNNDTINYKSTKVKPSSQLKF